MGLEKSNSIHDLNSSPSAEEVAKAWRDELTRRVGIVLARSCSGKLRREVCDHIVRWTAKIPVDGSWTKQDVILEFPSPPTKTSTLPRFSTDLIFAELSWKLEMPGTAPKSRPSVQSDEFHRVCLCDGSHDLDDAASWVWAELIKAARSLAESKTQER